MSAVVTMSYFTSLSLPSTLLVTCQVPAKSASDNAGVAGAGAGAASAVSAVSAGLSAGLLHPSNASAIPQLVKARIALSLYRGSD